jgi:hypothetical protein
MPSTCPPVQAPSRAECERHRAGRGQGLVTSAADRVFDQLAQHPRPDPGSRPNDVQPFDAVTDRADRSGALSAERHWRPQAYVEAAGTDQLVPVCEPDLDPDQGLVTGQLARVGGLEDLDPTVNSGGIGCTNPTPVLTSSGVLALGLGRGQTTAIAPGANVPSRC